jgi:hypothetical protein
LPNAKLDDAPPITRRHAPAALWFSFDFVTKVWWDATYHGDGDSAGDFTHLAYRKPPATPRATGRSAA